MSDTPAATVTGTPETEEYRTPKGDTVPIAEFSAFERAYLKSTERESGDASKLAIRRRIDADQRLATRDGAARVPVRETAGKFQTIGIATLLEQGARRRRAR